MAKKRIGLSFARFYCAGDFITDGLYVAYLIFQAAVFHTIDYSNAVVLFNQTGRLHRGMRGIAEIAPAANENSLYIEKIRSFLVFWVFLWKLSTRDSRTQALPQFRLPRHAIRP